MTIKMQIGDIVVVIGSSSLPISFLGAYGVVTDVLDYEGNAKVMVQFQRPSQYLRGLSHTAREIDLEKIGEINC